MNEVERGPGDRTAPAQRPGELPVTRHRPPLEPDDRWTERLRAGSELIPGIAGLAVFAFWALSGGGALPTDSYPGGIFLLGLLVATGYGYREKLLDLPRRPRLAITLLAAFVVWNFFSISWADDRGAAWDGANRCLVYLVVFTIFAIPRWRTRNAVMLLGLYAAVLAAIGAGTLIAAAGASSPLEYFIAGRFSDPTTYHNATAALFTGGMFPAIFLASRRETPWLARGAMLASAGILFQLSLLPQSRGWLLAAPLAGVVYFALVPGRVRSLIVALPLAAAAALTAGPMLDVFTQIDSPALGTALDHARNSMLLSAGALFAAGTALGIADRRIEIPDAGVRIGTRVVAAGATVVAIAAAIVAIGAIGNPASWASDQWQEFKGGQMELDVDESRLTQGLGSNRYDFWRVAVDEFRDKPLNGVGSENFALDYIHDRESTEEPFHPHSLPLRILSQTGLVGVALFVGFLAFALIAIGRIRLDSSAPLARGATGVIAVFFAYWLLHSSGDWFWAVPALTAPVFAFLGLGMRIDVGEESSRRPRGTRPLAIAGALGATLAAVSLLLPWMAALEVEKASKNWPADPDVAFERLDRARRLNFLSEQPDLVEGTIAVRIGDQERVRAAFGRALERFPKNWYARLELAALDALEGDRAAALEGLRRVSELNPREELAAEVRAGIESGRPVSLSELDASLLDRVCRRIGRYPTPDGCAAE